MRRSVGTGWLALGLLCAVGPTVYATGLTLAASLDHQPLSHAACLDAAPLTLTPPRLVAGAVMALGAVLFLVVTPWLLGTLLFTRTQRRRHTAAAWSLALNSAALILVCLLLRNTAGIDRTTFLVGWILWTAGLLGLLSRTTPQGREIASLWRSWKPAIVVGLGTVSIGIVLLAPEHFLQCFDGDGTEVFELAHSLRHHLLPYWEIEVAGRFGTVIVNPSLVNSYWTFGFQVLLGQGELATRLTFWVWWLGIYATLLAMTRSGTNAPRWSSAFLLAPWVLLMAVWYTFYTGYDPHMGSPANPGVTDAMFSLAWLLSLECLRQNDLAGWIVLATLSSLVLYAGPVLFSITVAAALVWQPVPRPALLRAALSGIAVLTGIALLYILWGWLDGSLSAWQETLHSEYVRKHLGPSPPTVSRLAWIGYFLLGCGVIPALGLLRPWLSSDGRTHHQSLGWERTVATAILAYLFVVVASTSPNLHYLGPPLAIPVVLWLRTGVQLPYSLRRTATFAALTAISLCLSIFLCWPASRSVFTANRNLGAVTTFQTDSYQQACHWLRASDLARKLYDSKHFGWYVGPHTWLHYSQLDAQPSLPRPLLITDAPPPSADYQLVVESNGVKLFCRDQQVLRWAADQQPPTGLDRCPRLLRPIAIGPIPRSSD